MGYVTWSYDTLNTFCKDVFQSFGFSEQESEEIKDVLLKVYLLHVRPGQGLHIVGGREMEIYLFLLFALQTLLGLAFIKARTLVLFWRKGNLLFLYGRPVLYCVFRNLALCIGAE